MNMIVDIKQAAETHLISKHEYILSWQKKLLKHEESIDDQIKIKLLNNFFNDLEKINGETLMKSDIIMQIVEQLSAKHADEFLKGAHFYTNDGGNLYHTLKHYGYERISTHHNQDKPFNDIGIKAGEAFAQLLVGVKGDGISWFQIENSPMPSINDILSDSAAFLDFIHHSIDTTMYLACKSLPFLTPINIGQYGTSEHLDYNPIILESPIIINDTVFVAHDSLLEQLNSSYLIGPHFHTEL